MLAKKTDTYGPQLYSETVASPVWWILLVICVVCVLVLAGYFTYVGELLDWANLIMLLFSIVAMLYFFNFSKLKISATTSAITVRYGVLKRVIAWEDIADCHADISDYYTEGFNLVSLESLLPVVRSKRKLVYHRGWHPSEGKHHVVLNLRRGEIEEFSFSAKNPEAVIDLVKQHIGKQEKQETI